MSENAQKPCIRFKGFSDAWEQRKLGEVAIYRRGSFPQPYGKKEWYDGNGAMSFVQVADVTDEMNLVENTKQKISTLAQPMSVYADKNSVLVTLQGSIGRVAITQYGAFIDRTVLIFEKYKEPINILFWAYIIKQKFIEEAHKAPGGTIKTITKEALSDFDLLLPKYDEQSRVGTFFKQLDNLITLHQCESCKKVVAVQSPFARRNLSKWTDSWEQRKFDELYEKVSEKNDLTYGTDEIISVANMYFKPDSFVTDIEYLRTYNVFHLGDIAFEGNKSKNFAHGRFVENTIGDGIVSHVFDVFRPKTKYDLLFWKYAINNERIMGGILVRSTKASTMMTNLVANDFLRETILVPSLEEQKQIGAILGNVDTLITLHQRIKIFITGDYHDKKNK